MTPQDDIFESLARQIEKLMADLNLSEAEKSCARDMAACIQTQTTGMYIRLSDDQLAHIRPITCAAALASALITMQEWVRKMNESRG